MMPVMSKSGQKNRENMCYLEEKDHRFLQLLFLEQFGPAEISKLDCN